MWFPIGWAEVIDQIAQFDKCDANPEALKADMKRVLERAFASFSWPDPLSLPELFKKIAEDATTVHQFHNLQKSILTDDRLSMQNRWRAFFAI